MGGTIHCQHLPPLCAMLTSYGALGDEISGQHLRWEFTNSVRAGRKTRLLVLWR